MVLFWLLRLDCRLNFVICVMDNNDQQILRTVFIHLFLSLIPTYSLSDCSFGISFCRIYNRIILHTITSNGELQREIFFSSSFFLVSSFHFGYISKHLFDEVESICVIASNKISKYEFIIIVIITWIFLFSKSSTKLFILFYSNYIVPNGNASQVT